MKRKNDEKERFRSASSRSRSKVDLMPLELKMATLTGTFLIKTHQKELFFRVERLGTALTVKELDCNDNEEDEKDNRSRSKVDFIPLDLQVEILTRLPGKSVLKFRCVSKMWSSITRSQRFIDSFFSMSSTRSRFIIVLSNGLFDKDGAKRLFIFSSSHEAEDSSSLVANLDIIIPSGSLDHYSKSPSVHGFVGCCYEGHFTICNPTTGQVIRVPCKGLHTSFGYDSVGDQFKALTMVTSRDQNENPSFKVHEVITLGRGGGGESRNEVTTAPYCPVTKGVCINGFVYYGAWAPRLRMNPVIVCFDVRYERLSFIKAPKSMNIKV